MEQQPINDRFVCDDMDTASWQTSCSAEPDANGDHRMKLIHENAQDAGFDDPGTLITALRPDVPVLMVSPRRLQHQYTTFCQHFPGKVTYAVKANPHAWTLRTLCDMGVTTFDVASPEEMRAVDAVCPDAKLHYNNPIQSPREIHAALTQFGVRTFTIDDASGLRKIMQALARLGGRPGHGEIEIFVRFALGSDDALYDFASKFGAAPTDAVTLLQAVKAQGFCPSLAFHPGSQCHSADTYGLHIRTAAMIAARAEIKVYRLNVGGGFALSYDSAQPMPTIETYCQAISKAIHAAFGDRPPILICEPGRALVGPAASLLARVKHKRSDGTLVLNDGIYGSLMELAQMPITRPARAWRGGTILSGEPCAFKIFGPTCDPLDVLPAPVQLVSGVAEADWIEFGLNGAYGAATGTRFNGYGAFLTQQVHNIL